MNAPLGSTTDGSRQPPPRPSRGRGEFLSTLPVHPLFFALYPVIALIAWNIQEIYLFQTVRSLVASLLLCGAVWGVFTAVLRDVRRAALLTSLSCIAFFSYGHLYTRIEDLTIASFNIGRHRYLVGAVGLALLLGWALILRARARTADLTRAFNFLGVALLVMPSLAIVGFLARPASAIDSQTTRIPQVHLVPPKESPPPDIIYIILDSYARSDYMTEAIGYDNRAFIEFLESQGFYVAERSRSNHNHTALSLSASLNMTPAQFLGVRMVKGDYPEPFAEPIRNSLVRRLLEGIGYKTVSMRSGYRLTEFPEADVYLSPDDRRVSLGARPNAFEDMLARTTLLQPLLESGLLDLSTKTAFAGSWASQSEIILSDYDYLENLPETGTPRFVFAHIMALHAPFLFERDGAPLEANQPAALLIDETSLPAGVQQYRDQAAFITERTEQMIQALLRNEERPPVVIVQGDTGAGVVPGNDQRAAILNAILIDERCRDMLYPTITPINTFRVVFNCYFGAHLELAPDDVFVSPWPKYFEYRFDLLPPEPD